MPTRLNIFIVFTKIGLQSFGSAVAEVIIETLVEKEKWLKLEKVREGYAVASVSTGPFHLNLIINLGYQIRGISGMLIALAAYILPSFMLAIVIAILLADDHIDFFIKQHPGLINGMLTGVIGLLINAIIKLSRGVIIAPFKRFNLLLMFTIIVLMLALRIPFIFLMLTSGMIIIGNFFVRERLKN